MPLTSAELARKINYGLTPALFAYLLTAQNSRCAICGTPLTETKYGLHVDHDHKSGVVRGLLCGNCNHGLGKFRDNVVVLQAAINYLTRAQAIIDMYSDGLVGLTGNVV